MECQQKCMKSKKFKKFNIPIIEDAAEALGSSIGNKKCGSFGDIGILSFNGNKIITTSGEEQLFQKIKNILMKQDIYPLMQEIILYTMNILKLVIIIE